MSGWQQLRAIVSGHERFVALLASAYRKDPTSVVAYCDAIRRLYGMKVHIYRDAKGEWRWRIKADNGDIVADSGEGYERRGDAVAMLRRIVNLGSAGLNLVIDQ